MIRRYSRKLIGRALRMFIRPTYRFIHIPKNAGMSVRDALSMQPDVFLSKPYHYRLVDLNTPLKCFGVVRNPWGRTASRFHFGKQNAARWADSDPRKKFMSRATFADFVREQRILPIPEHPGQPWMGPLSSWFNQLDWLTDSEGNVCDCLRMEHLEGDLSRYLNRKISLGRKNATKSYDYRGMYTDELSEIVAKLFSGDIEYFGFSFEGSATRNCVF